MNYTYASEKFASARRSLMLPHPNGDTTAIVDAFAECSHGLHNINRDDFDGAARESVRKLEELIDGSGLDDPELRDFHWIRRLNYRR